MKKMVLVGVGVTLVVLSASGAKAGTALSGASRAWGSNLGSWKDGSGMNVAFRAGYSSWEVDQLDGDSLSGPEFILDAYNTGTFVLGGSVALKILSSDIVDDNQIQAGFLLRLHLGEHVALTGNAGASFDWVDVDGDSKTGMGVYGRGGIEFRLGNNLLLYGEYQATGVTFGDEAKINGRTTWLNKENLEGSSVNIGVGWKF